MSRITAIEIDGDILGFREQFMLSPDDARLQVLLGDAADYCVLIKMRMSS